WSVREATYATAACPLTNSVELHLEIEFTRLYKKLHCQLELHIYKDLKFILFSNCSEIPGMIKPRNNLHSV
ncbi:hypothetical protein, partial [Solemya velum gill symbiont]|uniref:hypothetical protein n=1 Tax=Solemya velum gill symbiont TaxID=2340 RepID=UPI0009D122B3